MPHAGLPFGLGLGAGAAALLQPSADEHFRAVLQREAVDTGPFSPVWEAWRILEPYLGVWSNGYVASVHPSGSFAKGTANHSGTDLDLFISVRGDVPNTLQEIHDTLFNQLQSRGLRPTRQNVSIGVVVNGLCVDLVPGRQVGWLATDHNLFHKKTGTWRKTNVIRHIAFVQAANCTDEIRLLKLWRKQQGLDFPSFYLELAVIRALEGTTDYLLSSRFLRALRYLATVFSNHRFLDPANTANVISDDLTQQEKAQIQRAAKNSLASWPYVIR